MELGPVVVAIDALPRRFVGHRSFSMASLNARMRPATDGSPVTMPTELLCRKGADDHIESNEGGR
jgi:hypothetical protein